ncbi:hypothetical protein DL769_005622 [Monosporascus sp. CRB-8-3]|nr:hypothetical protein DL769_005622 [Monosporascus sp. CRB-8-3]
MAASKLFKSIALIALILITVMVGLAAAAAVPPPTRAPGSGILPRHLPVPAPHNCTDLNHHHGAANGARPDATEVGFVGRENTSVKSKTDTHATTDGVAIKVPHNCTDPNCTDPSHHHGGNGTRLNTTEAGFIGQETDANTGIKTATAAAHGASTKVPHNCTDPNHHVDANGMINCPSCQRSAAPAKLALNRLGLAATALPAAVVVLQLLG